TFVHQDHPGIKGRIWAGDEHYAVRRSFDVRDRTALLQRNEALRLSRIDSDEYVEYRPPRDVVLTSFFTGRPDPQRGANLNPDKALLEPLRKSVENLVVLHDCFDDLPCE